MSYQCTIKHEVDFSGIGLHSGKTVDIRLLPAHQDSGIVFRRVDLAAKPEVKADICNVTNTMRATTLECGAAKVFTVEHLLAAFYICGIDNCIIEINSVEPPVGDGSAAIFIDLIKSAECVEQAAPRKNVTTVSPIAVEEPGKFIAIFPAATLRISYSSFNPHPLMGYQYFDTEGDCIDNYESYVRARTIGFASELEMLKAHGLAQGGSLENALVFTEDGTMNEMRYPDEVPRHKTLDIVGDLFLAGRVTGHIIALNSSHELNTRLAKKLRELE